MLKMQSSNVVGEPLIVDPVLCDLQCMLTGLLLCFWRPQLVADSGCRLNLGKRSSRNYKTSREFPRVTPSAELLGGDFDVTTAVFVTFAHHDLPVEKGILA